VKCAICGERMLEGGFAVQSSLSRFAMFGGSWDALCFREATEGAPTEVVLDSGAIVMGFHCAQCGASLLSRVGKSPLSDILGPRASQEED